MLLIAVSVIPCIVIFFYRYPVVLLSLFPLVNLMDVFWRFEGVFVSSYLLLTMDPVYFFTIIHLGVCALVQPRQFGSVLKDNILLSTFLAIIALYVVLCTPIYGQSAIGEARKMYGFFLFPLLALLVIKKREDLRRFFKVNILAAAVVATIALGLAPMRGSIIRVVGADGALMIALAAFAMLIHRFYGLVVFHPRMDRVLLFLFAAVAISLGHRSVWLAIGLGLMLILWLYFARPVFIIKYVVVLLMLLVAGGAGLVYFPEVGARLGEKFSGIIDPYSDATASWRLEGWTAQLEELQKSRSILFGNGLGSYYSWRFGTATVKVTPHNAYVQLLLKLGLLGFIIYILLASHFFRRLLAVRKRLQPGQMKAYIEMGIVNVGAVHAYMLGYDFHIIILIYWAVALTAAKLLERELGQYRASRIPSRLIGLPRIPAPVAAHGSRKVSIG